LTARLRRQCHQGKDAAFAVIVAPLAMATYFAAGWQSHLIQTLASFGDGKGGPSQGGPIQPNDQSTLPATCCIRAERHRGSVTTADAVRLRTPPR
jgi:hypothetical protein